MRIGVIGTTAWGTMLAILAARRDNDVALWARSAAEAQVLSADRENRRFLPGAAFPPPLTITHEAGGAVEDADCVIIAVPSVRMRENVRTLAKLVPANAIIVCATKGIEIDSGLRMTQVIGQSIPDHPVDGIGVLSGPNLAPEIAIGKVSSATVAFPSEAAATVAQELLMSDLFRVYTSKDVTGVELGGALKNIIAIGAGIIDGLQLGDNAKAAFITRGLHEITRLGVAMGAQPETFAGLAGMGDLIATCFSNLSRNHRLGISLAHGLTLEKALLELGQNAEGVPTTEAATRLAEKLGVDMPITQMTSRVLFDNLPPAQALQELMRRPAQPEVRR